MKKKKNMPKSTSPSKIIRWISRMNEFERNGGGQFVAMNHVYKDKTKYNRKNDKREFRKNLDSYFFINHPTNPHSNHHHATPFLYSLTNLTKDGL